MSERYPDDATLLALTQDPDSGVEYIATGQSPYYLQFRKLMQRLLLAAGRANDLRVYQDGDLTIGVRPGRCVIANAAVNFAGAAGVDVANNAATHLWLNAAGEIESGVAGFPADRTAYLPLASVITSAGAIATVQDLRGEALLGVASLGQLGVTAAAAQINQALDGIEAAVDAAALNALTAGGDSTADAYHRHVSSVAEVNGESEFRLVNTSGGGAANCALKFDLPALLPAVTALLPDPATGWLRQRFDTLTYTLLGTVHAQYIHAGNLTATQSGKLIGAVPVSGTISNVILSLGANMDSSLTADGVTATVKVNGTAVTATDPNITDAAGTGFRSTAQGHGAAAVIKSDGTQNVLRGDVLTVDLTRAAGGTIATEAADVVVLVVIRPSQPE